MIELEPSSYRADYSNGRQLGPYEKFQRESIASVFNRLGFVKVLKTNQAGFDFDPSTLDCKGIHIEPAGTNLCVNSEFPNGTSDNAVSSNITVGFINGFTKAIVFTANNGEAVAYRQYSFDMDTAYTLSCFVEMADGGAPVLPSALQRDSANDFGMILFNSQVTGVPVVTPMGGRLYRCSVTATWVNGSGVSGNGGTIGDSFGICRYASNTGRGFKVTGYQLEKAPRSSSYIPTSASVVTRADSLLTVSSDSLLQIIRPTDGTMFFDGITGPFTGVQQVMMNLSDGTNNNRLSIFRNSSSGAIAAVCVISGVVQYNVVLSDPIPEGKRIKVAMCFRKGRWGTGVNGSVSDLSAATVPPGSSDRLDIGHANGLNLWNGHVGAWETHARAMPLADLGVITEL